MTDTAPQAFEQGRSYTRVEVAAVLGGGQRAVFPSRGGKVLGICVAEELNPRAPAALLAGPGLRHVQAARRLATAGTAVPVFIRRLAGRWEYVGERRVSRVVDDPLIVGEHAAAAAREGGAVVLLLEGPSPGDAAATAADGG